MDKPKYKTLKELAEAIKSGEVKSAHCCYEKEFVRVTSEKEHWDPSGAGENLYEITDDGDFIYEALRLIGVECQG